jgi:hypothetical protein
MTATGFQVLQAWMNQDVKDATGLKQRLRQTGISLVGVAAIQLGFDILAAYCSSATATGFAFSDASYAPALSFFFQGLFFYFAFGVIFDLLRLGFVIGGAASLGADANTLYNAVEQLAGESTGLDIVDKAQQAVSTSKVVLALNSVRRVLKVWFQALVSLLNVLVYRAS